MRAKTMKKPDKPPLFVQHHIPIYYADLWIGLLPDAVFAASTKAACKEILGYDYTDDEVNSKSLLAYRGSKFILAFRKNDSNIEVIAHEVFHLTHRILELCNCNFDSGHHEQGAYLNGWLMETVTKASGLKVTRRIRVDTCPA